MKTKPENKLKFETDKLKLSDEQIAKHKNFDKLLADYQVATKPLYKTPLYKNKKVFLVVLLISLVVLVIVESVEKKEPAKTLPQPNVVPTATISNEPADSIKKQHTATTSQQPAIKQKSNNRVESTKKDTAAKQKTIPTKIFERMDFDTLINYK